MIKVESCTQSAGAAVWWLTGEQEMGVGTQHAQDRTQQNSVDFITPLRTVHVDALWIHYFWNFPYVIFREWLKPQEAILWLRWELPWLLRCKYCTNQILSHWPEFHQMATRSQKKAAGHVFFLLFQNPLFPNCLDFFTGEGEGRYWGRTDRLCHKKKKKEWV